jgi:hypothetical protein
MPRILALLLALPLALLGCESLDRASRGRGATDQPPPAAGPSPADVEVPNQLAPPYCATIPLTCNFVPCNIQGGCTVNEQLDDDCDGVAESLTNVLEGFDNCPFKCNPDQADADGDKYGDVCDPCPNDMADDHDRDRLCGNTDNCPSIPNPDQADADGDGYGDACDQPQAPSELAGASADYNCNGIPRHAEGLCVGLTANLLSLVAVCTNVLPANRPCDDYVDTTAGAGTPAVCNAQVAHDLDLDGQGSACDNCPAVFNPGQQDGDADGQGDACDLTP